MDGGSCSVEYSSGPGVILRASVPKDLARTGTSPVCHFGSTPDASRAQHDAPQLDSITERAGTIRRAGLKSAISNLQSEISAFSAPIQPDSSLPLPSRSGRDAPRV